MITVLTVDEALRHICATFRAEADRGDITPTERDLMIDGAILLAMNVDDMARDNRFGSESGWPAQALPKLHGRHERPRVTAAA